MVAVDAGAGAVAADAGAGAVVAGASGAGAVVAEASGAGAVAVDASGAGAGAWHSIVPSSCMLTWSHLRLTKVHGCVQHRRVRLPAGRAATADRLWQ